MGLGLAVPAVSLAADLRAPLQVDYLHAMKPVSSAVTGYTVLDTGQIELTIQHQEIDGVSPAMLVWWFNEFPDKVTVVQGETVPWYWLWHPVDHVSVEITRHGVPQIGGFSTGARARIIEHFGGKTHEFTPTIVHLDESRLHLVMKSGGITIGQLEHTFEPTTTGTLYRSRMVMGSDTPIIRTLVNKFALPRRMPEPTIRAWFKHNVEEVGNFQFFLPDLYRTKIGVTPPATSGPDDVNQPSP